MRGITVIAVYSFVMQAQAWGQGTNEADGAQDSTNKLADESTRQTFKMWPIYHTDLNSTALGKSGNLQPSASSFLPRSGWRAPHALFSHPKPASLPWAAHNRHASLRIRPNAAPSAFGITLKTWPDNYRSLVKRGLKRVTGDEALALQKKGAVIMDVRPDADFEQGTISEETIHVPYTIDVQSTDAAKGLKIFLNSLLAVAARETNPDFLDLVREKIPKGILGNKPIVVMDNTGGKLEIPIDKYTGQVDMKASLYLDTNRYSNSLKAAFTLYEAGYKDIYFVGEGFGRWKQYKNPLKKPEAWQAFFVR